MVIYLYPKYTEEKLWKETLEVKVSGSTDGLLMLIGRDYLCYPTFIHKNPAYGRQRISGPMRIVGPIQFFFYFIFFFEREREVAKLQSCKVAKLRNRKVAKLQSRKVAKSQSRKVAKSKKNL